MFRRWLAGLPEVLELEGVRLGTAQAGFQRLLVITAAMLLLRQAATNAGRPLPAGELACMFRTAESQSR